MIRKYPEEWRTRSPWKKRFYAHYMRWLERLGYVLVALVIGAFVFAFTIRVDDVIAADKVAIKAFSRKISAAEPTVVVRHVVPNFSEVRAGQEVLEVVRGEREVEAYLAFLSLAKAGVRHDFELPKTEIVLSESAGVFVADPGLIGKRAEQGADLAEVRDYRRLMLSASLTGQGVAKATADQVATVRSITVSSANNTLVRGDVSGEPVVSGRLLSDETLSGLSTSLNGASFIVRDDIALSFSKISQLQVDATMGLVDGSDGDGVQVDPSASTVLRAKVVSGEHEAKVQFADLPVGLRGEVESAIVSSLTGRTVIGLDGSKRSISGLSGLTVVFQADAVPGEGSGEKIAATAVSRSFAAELEIDSPSESLMKAVRDADVLSQTVTAKVELKTGDRPIATLLLKRS